eukprot:scaffold8850_cov134-Isochrysis_galbana.AAC.2
MSSFRRTPFPAPPQASMCRAWAACPAAWPPHPRKRALGCSSQTRGSWSRRGAGKRGGPTLTGREARSRVAPGALPRRAEGRVVVPAEPVLTVDAARARQGGPLMRGTGHCLPPGRAGALRRCRPAGRALAPDGRQDRRGAVRLPPRAHSGCTGAQAAQDQILRGAGRRQGCGAGVLYYGVETGGWVPGQGRDKPRRGQRGRRGAGAGRCAAAGHAACWCCRGPGVDPRAKVHVGAPRHDGGRPEQHVERRQAAGELICVAGG